MNVSDLISWLKNQLTILNWLPGYTKKDFSADLKSGITVGVIEVPQVMAYAVIAGLSPIYGLYGSLIPLLVYPLFGTSRHLALGIVATDMIIIASGASLIAEPGSDAYVSVVLLLTLLVGIVHVTFSLLRMGFLVNLLSKPVIYGFMAAAPIIIGFSQLGNLMGLEFERSQYVTVLFLQLLDQIELINLTAFGIGFSGILLLLILKKINPLFPRALLLLASGGLAVWYFNLDKNQVDVIGIIPSGLPSFRIHEFTLEDVRRLIPTVTTLVLIQLMSVISLGKSFGNKYKYPISANREFFALGMANMVGSFFQSPPISASFTRTAVSDQAGTKSSLSNVVCAAVIALTLLFLTPLFYFIPVPALAAIIIMASLSLISISELRYFFKTKPDDAYIAVFTFFSIIFIGIQEGILMGIGASLFMMLYRTSRPNLAVLGHIKGTRTFRDMNRNENAEPVDELLILRFDSSLAFNNADYIKDFILQQSGERSKQIRAVIIDGKSINDMDTTAIDALRSVTRTLEDWQIELHFAGLKTPVQVLLTRSGLARELGGTHFHRSPHAAVTYLLKKLDQSDSDSSDDESGSEKSESRLDAYLNRMD
ncbi:SulP family inorganic anion transporter [Rhodohalobacter mucosus]|uniref:Sodium-independent anion transporter n=1 Tax=Rhodohalobacter mucosus TaxID=2079485 RepID=A0A316TNM5_9BACT|nr:sulfate permease [Rhodohalobacter mucosus]PWN06213.1 sodium-independent anion transporter [Rhodohalobacter mucosus]